MDNGGEYLGLAGIFQFGKRQIVEVSHDAWSDGVSTAPWRTHRAHEIHVSQIAKLSCDQRKSHYIQHNSSNNQHVFTRL